MTDFICGPDGQQVPLEELTPDARRELEAFRAYLTAGGKQTFGSFELYRRIRAHDSDIPRRIRADLWTPAEQAISDAVQAVEAMPGDLRLTAAVVRLGEAQRAVAAYVDGERFEPNDDTRGAA